MLKVEKYDHGTHIARLSSWLTKRGERVPDRRLFSDTGFVVDDCAIGFLFRTSSKQAYMDHVAADPFAPIEKRNAALDFLFNLIEETAKQEGFLMITALASLQTMRRRFEGHGYSCFGEYGLYYKVIGG